MNQEQLYSREEFFKRVSIPLTLFALVLILGSIGYYLLWRPEAATWLDAIYMTFITVTTVGYSEIHPLNSAGRILTIIVAITGIASLFYLFTAVMEFLVARRLTDPYERRKMQQKIKQLKDHTILVGYGKIGQHIAEELKLERAAFVVIDNNLVAQQLCLDAGHLFILGDAEEDEVLERAGVTKAKALISVIGEDATNAFVIMSARALNADLFIVAKADEDSAIRKLKKAGADSTINPYATAGQRLANMAVRPATVEFLSKTLRRADLSLSIEDVMIPDSSSLINKSLADLDLRRSTGVTVIAIIREANSFTNPSADFKVEAQDQLMILGDDDQQAKFASLIADSLN